MIHRLYSEDINRLLSLPESGMGYQIIQAKRHGKYWQETFIVFNAELIIDYDSKFFLYRRQIRNDGYRNVLSNVNLMDINNITLVESRSRTQTISLSEDKRKRYHRRSGGKGAIDSVPERANGSEVFVRLSAYENDKRIDFDNKSLRSGSYTTTYEDYKACVDTEDEPIDRYALPNDEKIQWSFFIKPTTNDILQRGIVQPAYEHDGGGIEAYFKNGTSRNTYFDKRAYGK